MIILHCSSK